MKINIAIILCVIIFSGAQCQEAVVGASKSSLSITGVIDGDVDQFIQNCTTAKGVDTLIREVFSACRSVSLRGSIPCEKVVFRLHKLGQAHEFSVTWNKVEKKFMVTDPLEKSESGPKIDGDRVNENEFEKLSE